MSSGKKLAKFGLIYTLAGGLQKGLGFVVFMYLAAILSVQEYANFGIYYAVFAAVSTISFAGLTESVVSLLGTNREKEDRRKLYQVAGTVFLLLSLAGGVIVFLFQAIGYIGYYNGLLDIFIIIVSAIISSYYLFQSILVRFDEAHIESITLSFIPAVSGYLIGFATAYYYQTSIAFFLGSLGGFVLSAALYKIKLISFVGFSFDQLRIKAMLVRLAPFSLIALIAWFLGYGNTFVIDYLFDDIEVARYVFLYTIASIIQLIASSMNQVWAPRFYNDYPEKEITILEKEYDRFTMLQGLVVGVAGVVLIFLIPYAAYFDESLGKYTDADQELFYLFLGYLVAIPWWHSQNYFFINNEGKSLLKITISSGVVGFLVWLGCMKFIGTGGIYLGFFCNMLVRSLMIFLIARKKWKIGTDYKGVLIGATILALIYLF